MPTLGRVTLWVFIVNILFIIYTAYIFFGKFQNKNDAFPKHWDEILKHDEDDDNWNPWGTDLQIEKSERPKKLAKTNATDEVSIEIWGKAAIGFYLWEHVLRGRIDKKVDGGFYVYGFKRVDNYKFKFRSGPLVTVNSLKQLTVPNLILVLNGRDKEKIAFASNWLNALKATPNVKNVGLVLLGDENCHNSWIEPFLKGVESIKFLFIVYDWKAIDDQTIFQWPLGVATYRNFPNPDFTKLNLHLPRPYTCNFIASIYPGSREELSRLLKNEQYQKLCFVKTRSEWQPKETKDSADIYLEALRLSDLTLSPVGMNHECYRIFEALSFGSVPVVEENLHHVAKTSCDSKSVYRLFRVYDAPFIYVTNWTRQLPGLLQSELEMSLEDKIHRRLKLVKWYHQFKSELKNKLLNVIDKKFFDATN